MHVPTTYILHKVSEFCLDVTQQNILKKFQQISSRYSKPKGEEILRNAKSKNFFNFRFGLMLRWL